MKIIDKKLLAEFRRGPCERCGAEGRTQAHHLLARGLGGGGRMDIRTNLIALCAECHRLHHAGFPPHLTELSGIVAKREKTTTGKILGALWRLRRAPKREGLPEGKRPRPAAKRPGRGVPAGGGIPVDQRQVLPPGPAGEKLPFDAGRWAQF